MPRPLLLFPLLLSCISTIGACSGGVAPAPGQSSGSSGSSSGSSGSPADGGPADGGPSATCTPGAFTFCRCADRSEGTKMCRADGASFDPCTCGG